MDDKPLFPLYVRLDDGTVLQIENENRILYHLEAIDIENDEYMFWDTTGDAFRAHIKKGKLGGFEKINMNKLTLQQAFEQYTQQLKDCGAAVDTMSGTPEQIWAKVEKAKETLPRRRCFFSRIFGKSGTDRAN